MRACVAVERRRVRCDAVEDEESAEVSCWSAEKSDAGREANSDPGKGGEG
jgi:hypothetical protein